jgi:hypothetical protein
MPVYNLTTNVAQERALVWAVARYNEKNGTSVTNQQFLHGYGDHYLDSLVQTLRERRRGSLEQRYEEATPAVKSQVNSALGYTD